MDAGYEVTRENPKQSANILSKLTYTWMLSLFYKGVRKGITIKDIYKTLKSDRSDNVGQKLERNWEKELARAKSKDQEPSLVRAIANTFLLSYMIYGLFLFIQFAGLRSFQPLVLGYLIRLFTGTNTQNVDKDTAMYITAGILIAIVCLNMFFQQHINFGQQCVGMRVRISVSALVYRKMLRLSKKSLGETAAGKIVNLLANDVNRFDMVAAVLHYIWISPFLVGIATYFLWDELGVSCLSGILSMVIFTLPMQAFLGRQTTIIRAKTAARTDYRVRLMNEIISGIQVIKMYAWEKPFEIVVKAARLDEVKMIRIANYLRSFFLSSMVFVERTCLYFTLITYVLTDNVITSDKYFTAAQYFSLLQMSLAIFLPLAIQLGAEAIVSVNRLRSFLLLEEKHASNIERLTDKRIVVENVNASWTPETKTLHNINLNIAPGSLCAIIGPVGAGKSSTLQLLLGELQAQTGSIKLGGDVSYAAQEPWLFGSSVRANILFGREYDRGLYKRVVSVCALEKDFEQFPQGDATLVGERGVSLSGGQRARINLARAVYRKADIYIMDDPLSAVDTHVGKHLFEECVMNFLEQKTRILVTHQLQFLKKADLIVVINEGKIEAKGTFDELSKSDIDFTKMLVAADETIEKPQEDKIPRATLRQESVMSVASAKSVESGVPKDKATMERNEEEIVVAVGATTEYLKSLGNFCMLFSILMAYVLTQTACSGVDYWTSYWTEQEQLRHRNDSIIEEDTLVGVVGEIEFNLFRGIESIFGTNIYSDTLPQEDRAPEINEYIGTNVAIYIHSGLIVAIITFTIMRLYLFFTAAGTSSKNLHAKIFKALLQAPMRFFDTNPSGRVLNRFSKDMGAVDETLPRVLNEAIHIMFVMVGALILICVANYYMIAAIVVLMVIFFILRKWFLATAKSIKHVEGIAKSPVFSHLNSTLNGISTIRASNAELILIQEFDKHQDVHTSAWFLTISCMVSFGLWLDMICAIFIACITFSFIILNQSGDVSGAMVGLAITQSLTLTGMLQYGMRQTAEVVNQFTSVERILQYTKLDKEGPFDTPEDKKLPKSWPNDGKIKFNNLYMQYGPNDAPVLRDLNLEVLPGEKIGIVGRTGAGKSSLISALYRLAPLQGEITIDDIDTQAIGLHDIRQKISIIPQEPVLFSAPMRYNLDPFEEYEDKDLWRALEEVELRDAVPSLDFKINEGGSNFSVGQRQLICLARAIVRKNKILLMDEATANVDPRTDGLIQTTIRRKFENCTVLTIAHRLNTIMDSDKVLVMDSGRIAEYGNPHTLLQNPDGYFTKLVKETGPSMTSTLRAVAEEAYRSKLKH